MTGYQSKSLDELMTVISKMNSVEELKNFFDDLCTIKELQDMAQRFETAVMLAHGKNYQEITSAVGTSTATISRVSKCLNYGAGGYKKAIEIAEDNK